MAAKILLLHTLNAFVAGSNHCAAMHVECIVLTDLSQALH